MNKNYEGMTYQELKAEAKEAGIPNYWRTKKEVLVQTLVDMQAEANKAQEATNTEEVAQPVRRQSKKKEQTMVIVYRDEKFQLRTLKLEGCTTKTKAIDEARANGYTCTAVITESDCKRYLDDETKDQVSSEVKKIAFDFVRECVAPLLNI